MSVLWKSWFEDCSQGKEETEGHNLCEITGVSIGLAQSRHRSVCRSAQQLLAETLWLYQTGHGWVSQMAIITQGFIHLCSWEVILQCVWFAALVFLTLMLSKTRWFWNSTSHKSLQNLRYICSDHSVRLLIWARRMLKEMHKIGPLDKAGVHKSLIKLECNLGISLMLL